MVAAPAPSLTVYVAALNCSVPGKLTAVVWVLVLLARFGSLLPLDTLAVFEIVLPFGVAEFTLTTRVKVAVAAFTKAALVAVIVPEPPTGGVVAVQPAGALKDTKVVRAGTTSVSTRLCASPGPLLLSICVEVQRVLPASATRASPISRNSSAAAVM